MQEGGSLCRYQFYWGDDVINTESNQARLATEYAGITVVRDRYKLVGLSEDPDVIFRDCKHHDHRILLPYLLDPPVLKHAVEEFEFLINDPSTSEEKVHKFFEQYPDFIVNDDYSRAFSKVTLENDAGNKLIPDFILDPCDSKGLCDLLELKKPVDQIYVQKRNRRRFSAGVAEAIAQLREYELFFDEASHREAIFEKYGLSLYKPRMTLIIGRAGTTPPLVRRRAELDYPTCTIKTYDDVLLYMKNRLRGRGGRA